MYISNRSIFVRDLAVAIANGGITLVILLIAPLGLAAVIMNTLLIMASTFLVCGVMDAIAIWLLKGNQPPIISQAQRQMISLAGNKPIQSFSNVHLKIGINCLF